MRTEVMAVVVSMIGFLMIFSSYFIGPALTGNVVYEPDSAIDCSQSDINDIWNSIFSESTSDSTTFTGSSGVGDECLGFVMFKNDSSNNIYLILREGDIPTINTSAYFVSGNETLVSQMSSSITDYSSGVSFVNSGLYFEENIVDRNIATEGDADTEFNNVFGFNSPEGFGDQGGNYFFVEIDQMSIPGEGNLPDVSIEGNVYATESFTFFKFVNYTNIREIEFDEDIPDFTFEVNSSWNEAFDFDDYFDYGYDAELGVHSWGSSNAGGSLIDFDLNGDTARFRPADGFIGSKDFVVYANNSAYDERSNSFTISIVEELPAGPEPPRILRDFGEISIKQNSTITLDLDDYFVDSDSSSLAYNYSGGENLDVTISGSTLTISLDDGFSAFSFIVLGASDGTFYTESPQIAVFLDEGVGTVTPTIENNDNPIEIESINISYNATDPDEDLPAERNNLLWIIIGGVVLIFVLIGGALFYYMFTKRNVPVDDKPKAVNSYLEKLKKEGKSGSFASITTSQDIEKQKTSVATKKAVPKKTVAKPISTAKKAVQTAVQTVKGAATAAVEKVRYVTTPVQKGGGWKFMGSSQARQVDVRKKSPGVTRGRAIG